MKLLSKFTNKYLKLAIIFFWIIISLITGPLVFNYLNRDKTPTLPNPRSTDSNLSTGFIITMTSAFANPNLKNMSLAKIHGTRVKKLQKRNATPTITVYDIDKNNFLTIELPDYLTFAQSQDSQGNYIQTKNIAELEGKMIDISLLQVDQTVDTQTILDICNKDYSLLVPTLCVGMPRWRSAPRCLFAHRAGGVEVRPAALCHSHA